jgi:hypothetical protein
MHEILHFQVHFYWENDKKSIVSTLSPVDFNLLKESLTVVLDNELQPLIKSPDYGYKQHKEFRTILHDYWINHHDFDKLIEYGVEKILKFTK